MSSLARRLPEGLIALVALGMLLYGPIPQLENYHDFADKRAWLGIANAGDVLSNLGFALVGLWGLAELRDPARRAAFGASLPGHALFLAGVALTAFGSAYYHLAPDNARLVWDRIPIALACAGLLAGCYADTHPIRSGTALAAVLAIAAIASVMWWVVTDRAGAGDLRPYLLIQFAPLLLVPLWQAFDRSPRAARIAFAAAIALYVAAKVAELNDRALFDTLGFMSGHTLKHLLATVASAVLAVSVIRYRREPLERT